MSTHRTTMAGASLEPTAIFAGRAGFASPIAGRVWSCVLPVSSREGRVAREMQIASHTRRRDGTADTRGADVAHPPHAVAALQDRERPVAAQLVARDQFRTRPRARCRYHDVANVKAEAATDSLVRLVECSRDRRRLGPRRATVGAGVGGEEHHRHEGNTRDGASWPNVRCVRPRTDHGTRPPSSGAALATLDKATTPAIRIDPHRRLYVALKLPDGGAARGQKAIGPSSRPAQWCNRFLAGPNVD